MSSDQVSNRRALELFERSFEHAPVGMLIVRDGIVQRVNAAFEELLGEPAEVLVGRRGESLVHPEDEAASAEAVRRTTAGEQLEPQDRRVVRSDGQIRTVQLRYSILDEGDGPPMVLIHVLDRTTELEAAAARERALTEFETSFDSAPIGICLVAPDGRLLRVNDALCSLLGRSSQELLSLDFQRITHPDDLATDLGLLRDTISGAIDGFDIEKRYLRPDGSVIDARLSVSLVRDPWGRPDHFISQIVDLTASRKASTELTDAKARLQAILDQLSEAHKLARFGTWDWELTEPRANWSDEVCQIFGRPPGFAPTYAEFIEHIHPDDRPAIEERIATRGAGAESQSDCRIIRSDGELRYISLRRFGRRSPAGETTHVFGSVQDITERKAAEIAVAEAREYAEAIIAAMSEGYALTVDGTITAVNDALCAATGFDRDELIGSGLPFPFWPPEGIESTMMVRDRIVAQFGGTFEAVFMRKDGTRFPAEVTARAAFRPDGSLLGYVNTMRDISERKTYEAELKRLATVDSLTGVLNQRVFRERLASEIARAERHGHPLSVVIFDLDHFKDVNDRYGHPVGDRVLVETAQRLEALVRTGEHLARIGGEEFAWILPYADVIGAEAAAERARHAVSAIQFEEVGTVTVSAGVCELGAGEDLETLYQHADRALYAAKQRGRNQTSRYGAL
jgi:diguanylate cyclase